MRLVYKLILILLFAALVPLSISSYFAIRQSQERLAEEASERHTRDARALAQLFDQKLAQLRTEIEDQVQLVGASFFRAEHVAKAARDQIYQSNATFDCVFALDARDEKTAAVELADDPKIRCRMESSPQPSEKAGQMFVGHALVPKDERAKLADVAKQLWARAREERGKGTGGGARRLITHGVYLSKTRAAPLTAFAAIVEKDLESAGKPGAEWKLLVVQVSLEPLQNQVVAFSATRPGGAFVFDDKLDTIAHPDSDVLVKGRSVADLPVARNCAVRQDFVLDGEMVITSCLRLSERPWGVVVFQPTRMLFEPVRDLRNQAIFWVGAALVFAVGAAVFFARGISRPVGDLAAGAREVALGNFDQRIAVRARDEIGLLAETFNAMGVALKDSREEIERQHAEIKRWNEELQQRVEERTRALREAQDQLLQSQKLAAIGELGAGVAHEINNPLAGVLGLTQLLLMRAKPEDAGYRNLKSIERESLKIREIVSNVLRFSQQQEGAGGAHVDVNRVFDDALSMIQSQVENQGIKIVREYAQPIPRIVGDAAGLQQAVWHMISNAKNAMPQGGTLLLKSESLEDKVVLMRIGDTGRGIPRENIERIFEPFFTTKDQWSGKGLGLSVAYRIVADHKGKISVESDVGKGSVFTITLPAAASRTQLV